MDKTFFLIFGGLFGLVGVSFLVVAAFTISSEIEFRKDAIAAPGVVVDLVATQGSKGGTVYKPVFEFTDRGDVARRVTGSIASSPPSFRRGEAVRVLYRSENPEGAQIDSFMESWFLPLIFGVLGTVFTGIAGGCGVYFLRKQRQRSWLAANGTRIQARVNGVVKDTSTSSGGRNPWKIAAQWQDPVDQKVYLFESDPIWYDPTPYLRQETVELMVNMDNPHQYVMNIDFLPKAG